MPCVAFKETHQPALTEHMNFLIKNLKSKRKSHLLRLLILFISFCVFDILGLLSSNFFNSIYLYSGGYRDNYYYGMNTDNDRKELPEEKTALIYNMKTKLTDSKMSVQANCSPNIKNASGIMISNRIFLSFTANDFSKDANNLTDKFKYVSKNSASDESQDNYPVKASFTYKITPSIKANLQRLGIKDITLSLIVDSEVHIDYSLPHSLIYMADKGEIIDDDHLTSGKDMNKQYQQGMDVFLPLIYCVMIIPMIIFLFSLMISLKQICDFEVKYAYLYRMMGMGKTKNLCILYLMRIIPCLLSLILSDLIFLPIYGLIYDYVLSGFLISLITFLALALSLFILSKKEIGRIYHSKLSYIEEATYD